MYRRTRKYNDERQRQTQATRERNRVESAAPAYPAELPDLRMASSLSQFDQQRIGRANLVPSHVAQRFAREQDRAPANLGDVVDFRDAPAHQHQRLADRGQHTVQLGDATRHMPEQRRRVKRVAQCAFSGAR